jgi:tetratricopeptide (TPR) repeat protein
MRRTLLALLGVVTITLATGGAALAQDHAGHGAPADRLGSVNFPNTCAEAVKPQVNRGVALLHSFWFDEAIRTFTDVAANDPKCGISQWGVALAMWGNVLAAGPPPAGITAALAAIEKGRQMGTGSERERDYLEAVAAFYAGAPEKDARARKVAYEKGMEQVVARNPGDTEAKIFYAMSLSGTQLPSDKTYTNLLKAANLLDPLFKQMPDHPGLAHYIIHAYDVPPLAPRALEAARAYAKIAPDAPHALHMPSHTFTRMGYWDESIEANIASAAAARKAKSLGDELHADDYLAYAYLQSGRDKEAKQVIENAAALAKNVASTALGQGNLPAAPGGGVGSYALTAMAARYALERGQWTEATMLAEVPGGAPNVQAMTFFARGLGFARGGGDLARARAEVEKLDAALQAMRAANQTYDAEQIDIQKRSVSAWISFVEGNKEAALAAMQEAAAMQDKTEKSAVSPGPIAPARELYAEMLLEAKQLPEALAAFEASAKQEPRRFRGVYGAAKTAKLLNDPRAAKYYAELKEITAKADTPGRPELAEARAVSSAPR